MGRFNARVRAKNFEESDLPELMAYLHGRGVKGYVTFNTLIFPDELAEAARTLRSIIAAGVDAAIVQDPWYRRDGTVRGVELVLGSDALLGRALARAAAARRLRRWPAAHAPGRRAGRH